MTLAGAMTVAKQGLIITELVDRGIVNAIVSTGALMAHGLVEATGKSHYKSDWNTSDVDLYEAGYNRVYDTLEPEENLNHVETVVSAVLNAWDADEVVCSYKLNRAIGEHLRQHVPGRGILKSACREERARLRPGIYRLGDGIRFRAAQPQAAQGRPPPATL